MKNLAGTENTKRSRMNSAMSTLKDAKAYSTTGVSEVTT